jgi:hypothetical protein
MARKLLSAGEIGSLVHQRVHEMETVRDDEAEIRIPKPYRHEPDSDGCNWNMQVFGNARGYEKGIAAILKEIRGKVNLK